MDILLTICVCDCVESVVDTGIRLLARCSDHEIFRDGDMNREICEVSVKFRILMIFMGIPALPLFIDSGLGKPLGDEVGISIVAGSGNGPGDFRTEFQPQTDLFSRQDRFGESFGQ